MPLRVPEDHFSTAAFAAAGPELFRSHTCMECGARATTWAGFRDDRRECAGRGRCPFLDAPPAALRALEHWRREQEVQAAAPPRVAA